MMMEAMENSLRRLIDYRCIDNKTASHCNFYANYSYVCCNKEASPVASETSKMLRGGVAITIHKSVRVIVLFLLYWLPTKGRKAILLCHLTHSVEEEITVSCHILLKVICSKVIVTSSAFTWNWHSGLVLPMDSRYTTNTSISSNIEMIKEKKVVYYIQPFYYSLTWK